MGDELFHAEGWIGGQRDMTKPVDAFGNFANAPKTQEEGNVTVLQNQAVHTDREITANRPDIIIKNNNVVQKEVEKKLKYKSLCMEIQRMWNLKCSDN